LQFSEINIFGRFHGNITFGTYFYGVQLQQVFSETIAHRGMKFCVCIALMMLLIEFENQFREFIFYGVMALDDAIGLSLKNHWRAQIATSFLRNHYT
jgi:hypothetical protein